MCLLLEFFRNVGINVRIVAGCVIEIVRINIGIIAGSVVGTVERSNTSGRSI